MKEMITNRHTTKKHRIDREKRRDEDFYSSSRALGIERRPVPLRLSSSLNKHASSEQKTAEEKIVMGKKKRRKEGMAFFPYLLTWVSPFFGKRKLPPFSHLYKLKIGETATSQSCFALYIMTIRARELASHTLLSTPHFRSTRHT